MQYKNSEIIDWIHKHKIIGVVRAKTQEDARSQIRYMYEDGLRLLEVSTTTPHWCDVISWARWQYNDINIGAGTILELRHAETAVGAGADFMVSPSIPRDVEEIGRVGIPFIPGVLTPSDISWAVNLGFRCVKLFPAGWAGLSYLEAVSKVFPQVHFLAFGGLKTKNLHEWRSAGAIGIGVGSGFALSGGDHDS